MENNINANVALTEQEDTILASIETSQMLLTALLNYIQAHSLDLNKETAIAAAISVHRIFADHDRSLIEFRLEKSFSTAANSTEK